MARREKMPQSRQRTKASGIHQSIKVRLGYEADQPDAEVIRDWRERLRRVCKPCWELKYCPYGPLVEESPLLPSERAGMVEHVDRLKRMVEANQLGEIEELTVERRAEIERWLSDDELIALQAYHELMTEMREEHIATSEDPGAAYEEMLRSDLPPIHVYRAPYDPVGRPDINAMSAPLRAKLRKRIRDRIKKLKRFLETGIEDDRRPLDPGRRSLFQKEIDTFRPEEYPERVPTVFQDGECNIFGHICPVFFAAEAFTETSTERRRGRYIPFAIKMRVVRRDNHTCQHCGKHLADNEVEFDHKIPISKGGSSEEQNIRLTCFDCNRDKRDNIEI